MQMTVFYATETGNAEMLAEDVAKHLGAPVKSIADSAPGDLTGAGHIVLVTSTYGEGELPSGARPFFEDLSANAPDLSAVTFSVFALGDQATYPETFAKAGHVAADVLAKCGARRVGPIGVHDAAGADLAEEIALPWIDAIRAGAA